MVAGAGDRQEAGVVVVAGAVVGAGEEEDHRFPAIHGWNEAWAHLAAASLMVQVQADRNSPKCMANLSAMQGHLVILIAAGL